ncbi:hypothetical protein KKH39_04635 [Patescibacteria group bacterium]|nr:hypothetical protein [Patescibacteria group bacterium]
MAHKNITIFANIFVNNQRRFQHLKDSFNSFKDISDNWLINVRGDLREDVIDFLKQSLGNKMVLFELLDDNRPGGGWFRNALDMVGEAKHDYILVWNEDHVNLAPQEVYPEIIKEMKENNVDYMMYSWWVFGEYRKNFLADNLEEHEYIDTVYLTKKLWKHQLDKGYDKYIISMSGIFNKKFLIKLLKQERYKLPRWITTNLFRVMILLDRLGFKFNHRKYYDLINRLIFGKLTKWQNNYPFELEKSPYRWDILPIKMGLAKYELFACIDDNLGYPGSDLISRGLYKEDKKYDKRDTTH